MMLGTMKDYFNGPKNLGPETLSAGLCSGLLRAENIRLILAGVELANLVFRGEHVDFFSVGYTAVFN